MGVFVVISKEHANPALEAIIVKIFPDNYYKLSSGSWLISSDGTAKKVAEDIGITDKEKGLGAGVVLSAGSYWGMYDNDLWDWLKAKMESSVG